MKQKGPSPLFVWKLIFVVILAASAFIFFYDPMNVVFARRNDRLSQKLSEVRFRQGEMGIVFFGDSLLNAALPVKQAKLNSRLSEEFAKQGISRPSISGVEITSGGVSAMQLDSLAEKIIRTKPSVIVIQTEIFANRYDKQSSANIAQRPGTWSGVLSLQLFDRVPDQAKAKARKDFFVIKAGKPGSGRPRQTKEEGLQRAINLWSDQVISMNSPPFVTARNFVDKASRAGITVVVVELPVSNTAAAFAPPGYLKERTAALEVLSKSGVLHLVYPRILPDDHFRDYSHLNTRGRREFLQWFFPELSKELAKRETHS